jgi:hypothetical protein
MSAKGMGILTVRNGGPPKRLNKGTSTKISWSEARVVNQNLKETSMSGYEGTKKKRAISAAVLTEKHVMRPAAGKNILEKTKTKPGKRAVEEAHSAELDRDDHVENKSLRSCNLWKSARRQKNPLRRRE